MDPITQLFQVDIIAMVSSIFIVLFGLVAIVTVVAKVAKIIGKPIRWFQMNNEDHDLIVNLTATVQEFNDKYKQNVIQTENNTKQLVRIASSLTSLIEDNKKRDEQIESLVFSQQKELADRISQLCKQYMDMEGIPEDELQEFIDLHAAYKAVHGNHGIDTKYNYCIEHLPIIPSNRKIGEIKK